MLFVSEMPPRPQYSVDQRNYLVMEYHRRRGTRDFKQQLVQDFQGRFPGTRAPGKNMIVKMWEKQMANGTVHNLNSATSPGGSHSGRPRTTRTQQNKDAVKAVMDRDAGKEIGDGNASPVSSGRKNVVVGLDKSGWWRLAKELKYHPYKAIRRQLLKP